ncbi:uncharacterized protein LOC125450441 [Stegostoma tigrinum]|uniref:uncharacterized protein LOC125450441 n=1 Tax=Stegostoma tigrinum TaxID=3053191 RepID=UPI0028707280|nr:uncharacterized protein LOC125450441 [Stegostoma tigrinum]
MERAGSAVSDTKCHPGRLGQQGPLGQTATDSTSVSLAVISGLLLVLIVLSSYCVMLDLHKSRPLQLSCFKWVFKSCNAHPEPETGNENLPEDLRTEELLGSVVSAQCDPGTAGGESIPVEREALQSEQSRPCPIPEANPGIPGGADSPVRPPLQTDDGRSPGKETPKGSGIIGPVYIYNPSRVYVGVISDQRSSQRSLRGRADPATDDGILRYPQEEQGAPQRESGHLPEQESGKESHLPESASEDP